MNVRIEIQLIYHKREEKFILDEIDKLLYVIKILI